MNQQTTNTRCLIEAAKRLNLSYEIFDKNDNFVRVKCGLPERVHSQSGDKNLDFANYSTPFNTDSFCKITKDKEFTSFLLNKVVKMPKTLAFVDPNYDEGGEIKPAPDTIENYANKIIKEFSFPIVLKPNSLSGGKNYFLCNSKEEIMKVLERIYEKTKDYDYLALAQEYIKVEAEYRVIVFQNEVILVYTRKKLIIDDKIIDEIKEFIKPIFTILPIGFAGLDIIVTPDGRKYLLEINSEPGFANFVAKNGDEVLIGMYRKILKHGA